MTFIPSSVSLITKPFGEVKVVYRYPATADCSYTHRHNAQLVSNQLRCRKVFLLLAESSGASCSLGGSGFLLTVFVTVEGRAGLAMVCNNSTGAEQLYFPFPGYTRLTTQACLCPSTCPAGIFTPDAYLTRSTMLHCRVLSHITPR